MHNTQQVALVKRTPTIASNLCYVTSGVAFIALVVCLVTSLWFGAFLMLIVCVNSFREARKEYDFQLDLDKKDAETLQIYKIGENKYATKDLIEAQVISVLVESSEEPVLQEEVCVFN